jgi:hypothetical protein
MEGGTIVDQNVVQLFNHVIRQIPLLKVVVSSTWRLLSKDVNHFCEMTGINKNLIHEDWKTISLLNRGLEIKEWLHRHDITEYVVVDDTDDGIKQLCSYPEQWRFVHTDHKDGLTLEGFNKILSAFGYRLRKDFTIVTLGGPVEQPLYGFD